MVKNHTKQLIQDGKWVAIGFVIRTIIQLLVSMIITRLLPPITLGDFYLFGNIVPFLTVFASLGLPQTILKSFPAKIVSGNAQHILKLSQKYFLSALAFTVFIGALLFLFFPSLYARFFSNSYELDISLVVLAWILGGVMQSISRACVLSLQYQKSVAIYFEIIPQFISLIGFSLVFFLEVENTFFVVLLVLALNSMISALLLFLTFRRGFHRLDLKPSNNEKEESISIQSVAVPLWITGVMLFILAKFDLWVVKYYGSSVDVALYGTALKLTIFVHIIFMLTNAVVSPMISGLYEKKALKELETIIRIAATISSLSAFVLIVTYLFAGKELLGWLYGDFYSDASLLLVILSLGVGVNVFTGCSGTVLMLTAFHKIMMKITVISGIITITVAIWVAQYYGAIGVATAVSSGMLIQNILMYYFVRTKVNIRTHFSLRYISIAHFKKIIQLRKS